MKTLIPLFFASLIGVSILSAEDENSFPNLSKALPTEKLFNQTKLEGIETYAYATDLNFGDLKKNFSEFLGKGWSEAKLEPEMKKATNEAMKEQGLVMEGNTLFSNAKFPGVQIGLTQIKLELVGKKFMANITVIRHKTEQGGADQPATAPESKLEGREKPKPDSEVRPQ